MAEEKEKKDLAGEFNASGRGMVEEIIINLKRVESDYKIDLTKEMEWLRGVEKKKCKDLALTWQDIKEIDELLDDLLPTNFDDELMLKGYYEEVLKRFKSKKV